jgi:flavin reductase (DIM6/NTAB) family NADH-FMN oxidoreductase RutF
MDEPTTREALGRLIYGVYLLTVRRGEEINGMPVSWVSQVSHHPPLLMICVARARYTHSMLKDSGAFALNIMERGQRGLVDRFMARDVPKGAKFEGLDYGTGVTGCPILKNALAFLECRVTFSQDTGDHTIFVGEVVSAGSVREGVSLSEADYGHSYGG